MAVCSAVRVGGCLIPWLPHVEGGHVVFFLRRCETRLGRPRRSQYWRWRLEGQRFGDSTTQEIERKGDESACGAGSHGSAWHRKPTVCWRVRRASRSEKTDSAIQSDRERNRVKEKSETPQFETTTRGNSARPMRPYDVASSTVIQLTFQGSRGQLVFGLERVQKWLS